MEVLRSLRIAIFFFLLFIIVISINGSEPTSSPTSSCTKTNIQRHCPCGKKGYGKCREGTTCKKNSTGNLECL